MSTYQIKTIHNDKSDELIKHLKKLFSETKTIHNDKSDELIKHLK